MTAFLTINLQLREFAYGNPNPKKGAISLYYLTVYKSMVSKLYIFIILRNVPYFSIKITHKAMASKTASSNLILSLLFFLSTLTLSSANASNKVSAVFAFGDSTIDSGNNNRLNTLFRCDHIPYGRDFPTHVPTGRFSNGKISTDYLTQILGIKELLPAFLDPQVTDRDLLTGVSFGSGGSGLDNRTVGLTRVLDLDTQFELFEKALMRIRNAVGDEKANDVVRKALFVISTGTNDMLYNAYMSPRLSRYGSVSAYQDFLLQNLQNFIQVCILLYINKIFIYSSKSPYVPPLMFQPCFLSILSLILLFFFLQQNSLHSFIII